MEALLEQVALDPPEVVLVLSELGRQAARSVLEGAEKVGHLAPFP